MKIAVIGGGSTYTPELAEGLLAGAGALGLGRITLMDLDRGRLDVVAGMVRRMAVEARAAVRVEASTSLAQAVDGAAFVVNQVRVGGMAGRRLDELVPREFGIVGQETTGPGGFAYAMRAIPVALDIARAVAAGSPDAWIVNFANPAGLVTEALARAGTPRVVGLCNTPPATRRGLADALGVPLERLEVDYAGLNHLGWTRAARVDGRDVMPELIARVGADRGLAQRLGVDPAAVTLLEAIPSPYLRYYYEPGEMFDAQLVDGGTRADAVAAIEGELLAEYARPEVTRKPALLAKRGGAEYSRVAVAVMRALAVGPAEVHVVNVPNGGAVPDLPADAVAEIPCRVSPGGIEPIPVAPFDPRFRGLLQAVKAYEQLAVEAALSGDHRAAGRALAAHPLVPGVGTARRLWAALWRAHEAHLPQFRAP